MIDKMQVLLRVKQLKEEQALRALQLKRTQVREAEAETERARVVVDESRSTLGRREDAIYDDVLGQVVDLDALDTARGRVVKLEQDHQRLKDAQERAAHVQHRLEGELDLSSTVYRGAVRVRDKYLILTEEMRREIDEAVQAKEEAEIEDLFARPRKAMS